MMHCHMKRAALCATAAIAPLLLAGGALAQPRASAGAGSGLIEEIVVTATRQEQSLSTIPVSVTAFSQARMDTQGVKQIDDLVRLTPGVNLNRTGTNIGNISIRGISSGAGAATTGIYIDDTPIQARVIAQRSENAYPTVFDLQRIEVLRGPQGTLFGAGSQGGTIRFITPDPSLTTRSGYGRAEVSKTEKGSAGYEIGYAMGGPLVRDKLGFRASAFYRHAPGYIDRVNGTFTLLSPTGALGPSSIAFNTTGVGCEDCNQSNTTQLRLALAWAVTPQLRITPSINYQRFYSKDYVSSFFPVISDYDKNDFRQPQILSVVDATHNQLSSSEPNEPVLETLALPAIKGEWDFGSVRLTTNTAYYYRRQVSTNNSVFVEGRNYGIRVPRPGDNAIRTVNTQQNNFTQEARLQSTNAEARLTWVAGVFYSDNIQTNMQKTRNNFLGNLTIITANNGSSATNGGAPFGPGVSAFVNYFGVPLIGGELTYLHRIHSNEKQVAGFGQVDFKVTPKLKATAGLRVASSEFSFRAQFVGAVRNLNQPIGRACIPNSNPCQPVAVGQYRPGEGPFAPVYFSGGDTQKETPVTPKFGLSYQADDRNLFYANVAKGYRIGGAQDLQPSACNAELITLGYVDGQGRAQSPPTYDSDTVWSYELGAKNRLGRFTFDSSVYYITWKGVQSVVPLSTCGRNFVDNLTDATSRGFDVSAQAQLFRGLTLGGSVAYNKSTFNQAVILNSRLLYSKDSALPDGGAPWTVILSAQYDFDVGSRAAYVRGDYTYTSALNLSGATDPASVNYDNLVPPRPESNLLNARAGIRISDVDVSVFVNNLLNAAPSLGFTRTRGQPIYTDTSFRPRTVGLTASYRY